MVGGVAANNYISDNLKKIANDYECSIILPPNYMLGDNAAMIGWACLLKSKKNIKSDIFFKPDPRLEINGTNL